jgi:ferritin
MFNPIEKIAPSIIQFIGLEHDARVFYRNAANYCENVGYDKAAAYYAQEAISEAEHAVTLQTYLNDWGVRFTIPATAQGGIFTGLGDIVAKAYDIEADLYKRYDTAAKSAMGVDTSAYQLFSKMLNIQYESVAECRTLVDKLALYNDDKTGIKLFEHESF